MMRAIPHEQRGPGGRAARRGASYVFFLGTALLVATIGLTALAVMRVKLRAGGVANDRAAARFYAQSAIDAALLDMAADDQWRDHFTHGTWETTRPIGDGSLSYKVVDETNGDLTTDPNGEVRVFGKGLCGEAVWVYSVMVQPPPTGLLPDLVTNGDLETGVATPWTGGGSCDVLAQTGSAAYGGTYGLEVENRIDADSAAYQYLASSIELGATYYADVWVKMKDAPDTGWLKLRVETLFDTYYFEFARVQVSTDWTHLYGTVSPTAPSSPTAVAIEVGTVLSSQDFMIDEVSMRLIPTEIGPRAGTWQREAD